MASEPFSYLKHLGTFQHDDGIYSFLDEVCSVNSVLKICGMNTQIIFVVMPK